MMKHKRRGNLLLSALFMSAFLFFLSVAIVVTNREDIRSTLGADHKMRAEFAADGTLDRDIQLMRSTADWESTLNSPVAFASGATVQSSYKRISPTILELDVTALSNLVRADRHWILEELRLADSVAVGSQKPHLFCLEGTAYKVLGPNFKWQALGTLPALVLPRTFSARSGPLYYLIKDDVPSPVALMDFQPIQGNPSVTNGGFGPASLTLPKSNGPYTLELQNEKFNVVKIVEPADITMLGRLKQPTINGQVNGTPTSATIIINGVPTLVDTSVYQGPIYETYLLVGTVAVGVDKAYYCHAMHYYYRGFKFQNDPSTGVGTITQPVIEHEPAILKYDVSGKVWVKVVDLLKVPDDQSIPEVIGGPRPDQNYLWVTDGGVVYSKDAAGPHLLTINGNQFSPGSSFQGELFTYQDQLISVTKNPTTGISSLSRMDPALTLPKQVPGRNVGAKPFVNSGMMISLQEEKPLDLRYSTSASPVAAAQKDLFALVTTQAYVQGQSSQTPQSSTTCLAHFDGTQWQFLPNGMASALPGSSFFLESQRDYGGAGTNQVTPASTLALGGYVTNQPLLRRYSPRFHY